MIMIMDVDLPTVNEPTQSGSRDGTRKYTTCLNSKYNY